MYLAFGSKLMHVKHILSSFEKYSKNACYNFILVVFWEYLSWGCFKLCVYEVKGVVAVTIGLRVHIEVNWNVSRGAEERQWLSSCFHSFLLHIRCYLALQSSVLEGALLWLGRVMSTPIILPLTWGTNKSSWSYCLTASKGNRVLFQE